MTITPEYTKKAINKYNAKFDRVAVNLPKGAKDKIKQLTGLSCNAYINNLVKADLERLEAAAVVVPVENVPKRQEKPVDLAELQAMIDAERTKRGIKAPEQCENTEDEPPKKRKPLPWQDIPRGIVSEYIDKNVD